MNECVIPLSCLEMTDELKSDFLSFGGAILVMLQDGGPEGNLEWPRTALCELLECRESVLQEMVSRKILGVGLYNKLYLDLTYPLFSNLYSYFEEFQKPKEIRTQEEIQSSESERVLYAINELRRKKFNQKPIAMTTQTEELILRMLGNHGRNSVYMVLESYFEWGGLTKDYTKPQNIFSNFEKKLTISKDRRGNKGFHEKEISQPQSTSSSAKHYPELFKLLVTHYEQIDGQKVRILFRGPSSEIRVLALAYRLFRKKINGHGIHGVDQPYQLWDQSYVEARNRGGLNSNSPDELNINGKFHTIPSIEFKVEDL